MNFHVVQMYMYLWTLSFRLTLFWMGEGRQKAPPPLFATSFSVVTSTNVRINPQHFLIFLLNFGNMTTYTIKSESLDQIWLIMFILKYLYFKETYSSNFCWHHQNYNHVYWNIFKDSKNVKRIRNYVSKCKQYLYFLI